MMLSIMFDRGKTPAALVESYARQLRIYKGAVEKRLGVAVKKLTLYAVALRREVDVPLEEAQGHGAGV